jgi:hypothetical protein
MVYMYIVKHNFILGAMCYYTKAQLHVSAIKVVQCLGMATHTTKNKVVFHDIHIYHLTLIVILTKQRG